MRLPMCMTSPSVELRLNPLSLTPPMLLKSVLNKSIKVGGLSASEGFWDASSLGSHFYFGFCLMLLGGQR